MTDSKQNIYDSFNPESLTQLRALLLENPALSSFLSMIFVFEVVIDSNMMVSDLIARRRHKGNPSNNERLVKAGVLKLNIPSGAILEMETRTIPKVAKKRKIPTAELMKEWEEYKLSLIIHEEYDVAKTKIEKLKDPDDAIYVELMNDINALGVLTFDKHYDFLEFKAFNVKVLVQIQSYTTAITNSLHLKICGVYGVSLTGTGLVHLAKFIVELWKRAPSYVQLLILLAAGVALVHEPTRGKIVGVSKKATKPIISSLGTYAKFTGDELNKAETIKREIIENRAA